MNWSGEKPVIPGYYLSRFCGCSIPNPDVVFIDKVDGNLIVTTADGNFCRNIKDVNKNFEWLGPLPE